ncbi:neuronal acetylcholine receptor subunit alpha-3-like [Diadema setosum]|uniref:neuronal acetylcholine receptor subunit alpha-3-like n=1 Tax=Diadema setosum TaxID=31175 RepID=UPI003B3B9576
MSMTINDVLLSIVAVWAMDVIASEFETELHSGLFDKYDVLPLPVSNASEILNVYFGLSIQQILDIDERNQVLTSKVWVKQQWKDYRLQWDPKDYGGIEKIKVPNVKLWIPDILLYNNADGPFDVQSRSWASVQYDGQVTWFPPNVYKSSCKINVAYYPFDEQHCDLKFGSWTYDGDVVDLLPISDNADRRDYWDNGEWQIIRSPGTRHRQFYPCCAEPYIDITYTLTLRRKPLYYFAYVLMPCGLISFNTVLVFYLPPDISEKMSLCMSVLLSMTVFLLLITAQIPANANHFPLIVKYLLFTMLVVSSSIVLTVFVLNVRFRSPETHTMSPWIRRVFIEIIPKYLGMSRPEQYNKRYRHVGINLTREAMASGALDSHKIIMENKGNKYTVRMRRDIDAEMDDNSDDELHQFGFRHGRYLPTMAPSQEESEAMVIHKAVEEIMYLTWRCANEEDSEREREDWKFVAMVIDRIFLIIYLCGVFIGTVVIIFEAPLAIEFFREWFCCYEDWALNGSSESSNETIIYKS